MVEWETHGHLSVFYIDISEKQVMGYDWDTLAKTITNAARAHSRGFELRFRTAPMHGLSVFAGFGYNEAKFDEFTPKEWNTDQSELIEKDYGKNYLPYAPRYTCNVAIQYRSRSGLSARADLFGTGPFYGDVANESKQDAYETLNLRVGYEGERFDIHFWIDNVFDKGYLTFVFPYEGSILGLDAAPRTFGARITWRHTGM